MDDVYQYPDEKEWMMASLIEQSEPQPGYWQSSETAAFARLDRDLEALLPSRDKVRALDAGCGRGRLLPWVARYSAAITASDADSRRLNIAVRDHTDIDGTTVAFEYSGIESLNDASYDLIVCSHVIQHVPMENVSPILRRLTDLASPESVMVLFFNRSAFGEERYGLSYLEDGGARVEEVDQARYQEVVTRRVKVDALPFRLIDPEVLVSEVSALGWSMEWQWTYHVDDESGDGIVDAERDEVINGTPSLLSRANGDIVTLWRRVPNA
ncbi:class I SAM-dependent methyltransferase [Streptomyces sp. NPDC056661]|uniref:class I SAM-dependent methyltransferase n=1 Tax=Streptomyces sp. NPDC056661 TaxID=3345898 RepID=UPI0036BA9C3B